MKSQRARIFIVEDNALNLQLHRDLLEYRGHQVSSAATVGEAWAALQGERPDLLLLDIHVPGGGGERHLREIRASSILSSLPVIAVTALAMEGDRERLLAQGFDGYLAKPIDTRTFGAAVEAFLPQAGGAHGP
jgi:two-component system cell cycle response regulator